MVKYTTHIFLLALGLCSCSQDIPEPNPSPPDALVRSVDLSTLPEINEAGTKFYRIDGTEASILSILKESGVNTIRLRLWVDPVSSHSSLTEVINFNNQLRQEKFKIWLTVHFSDTWADPGHQAKPRAWENLPFKDLLDTVYQYTSNLASILRPEIIQVGNEINNGFLYPDGSRDNRQQFHQLLIQAIQAIRDVSPESKVMLHIAGHNKATYFFDEVDSLDYDLIGISYYPIWHGKNLDSLKNKLVSLADQFKREIMIAETAYPFTLGYNDWTNNIVGLPEQLIPGIPASVQGQKEFLKAIKKICDDNTRIRGFSYWGTELVAWKGQQALDGSPWENQALFDFNNRALESLAVFNP